MICVKKATAAEEIYINFLAKYSSFFHGYKKIEKNMFLILPLYNFYKK